MCAAQGNSPDAGRLRVLIVEDDPAQAEATTAEVKSLGHQALPPAGTCKEAAHLCRALQPDLILLDIKLPDGDGLECAPLLLEQSSSPVVVLTGYISDELVEKAAQAGVMAYLMKPVDGRELRAAIALARKRFEEFRWLRQEVKKLEEALEARKLVERSKGILMKRLQLSEEEAYLKLQKRARDSNRKLAEVARSVIEASELM
jgi:response regulator NasT